MIVGAFFRHSSRILFFLGYERLVATSAKDVIYPTLFEPHERIRGVR